MTEVIHEHTTDSGNSMGVMVGVLLAIVLILFLFFYFGRGLFSGAGNTGTTTPQINVPNKMDINVKQTK